MSKRRTFNLTDAADKTLQTWSKKSQRSASAVVNAVVIHAEKTNFQPVAGPSVINKNQNEQK